MIKYLHKLIINGFLSVPVDSVDEAKKIQSLIISEKGSLPIPFIFKLSNGELIIKLEKPLKNDNVIKVLTWFDKLKSGEYYTIKPDDDIIEISKILSKYRCYHKLINGGIYKK